MSSELLNRILKESGVPELMEVLVNRISLADLQSLLLEVYKQRVEMLSPPNLLDRFKLNRFVQNSDLNPQQLLEFDSLAYSLLPSGFKAILLSPVCPLGTNTVVAPVNQNNIVTTIRNTEVCADPTNVMALECALQRRLILAQNPRSQKTVKLCSSQRVLRGQAFDEPGAYQHFQIFSLCTSGRDEGDFVFETKNLQEHLFFYLKLLLAAMKIDLNPRNIRVVLMLYDESLKGVVKSRVLDKISLEFPEIESQIDEKPKDGHGYYCQVRFQVYAQDSAQTDLLLVDGGFTDWTQKLLSNQKERLLTSGIGSERLCLCFHK